jgi:DNA-binding NtrC family response regulator
VAPEDLGLSIRPAPAGTPIKPDPSPDEPLVFDVSSGKCTFDAVEKALLTQTLAHTRGNVTRTAALLGLTRASVRYRMETHGLSARAVEAKSV